MLMTYYFWDDTAALKTFKAYLSDCFKMKDLGSLKYVLGIEVARSASGLFLCQRKYTIDIISEAGLSGAKPCGFPDEQNHCLGRATGPLMEDPRGISPTSWSATVSCYHTSCAGLLGSCIVTISPRASSRALGCDLKSCSLLERNTGTRYFIACRR